MRTLNETGRDFIIEVKVAPLYSTAIEALQLHNAYLQHYRTVQHFKVVQSNKRGNKTARD